MDPDFFSLNDFPHASLWNGKTFLWEALDSLDNYFSSFKFKKIKNRFKNVYFKNEDLIFIGENVEIDPYVLIEGPCIIGDHCAIRHGALLRANTILGNGCSVGHGSEVKGSIVLENAKISHLCYVGDSIIGPSANLGAGVKCSNLRLDAKPIKVLWQGKKIDTGLKKLGAILGEGVQIGCNAVLNPGTIVGKESEIFPLLNVGGFIPAFSQVKGEAHWKISLKSKNLLKKMVSFHGL